MIKHLIRDVFIWGVSIFGFSKFYQKRMKAKGPLVRVLCFHDVLDEEWFEQLLCLLHKKYNVITPRQFHSQDFDPDKVNILLTFDDGYQSWLDVVIPVLDSYKTKGLFFVTSGLLDAAERGEEDVAKFMQVRLRLQNIRRPLSWDGAKRIIRKGHSVGGHTENHIVLSELNKKQVTTEVSENKIRLEGELGLLLQDFAYPFGTPIHYNRSVASIARDCGYTHLYSASSSFVDFNEEDIGRTLLDEEVGLQMIERWIEGGYDIFRGLKR